jgi:hypothetical protein
LDFLRVIQWGGEEEKERKGTGGKDLAQMEKWGFWGLRRDDQPERGYWVEAVKNFVP